MASLFGAVKSMVRGKRIEDFLNTGDGRLIDWTDEEILKMKRYNLQVELAKRNLEVKGNKKTLRQRLMNAVREEKEQKLAYEAMIESKRKAEADLEASGSIYVVGRGGEGQLGLDEGKTNRRSCTQNANRISLLSMQMRYSKMSRFRRSSSSSSHLQVVWSHCESTRRTEPSRSCQKGEKEEEEDTGGRPRRRRNVFRCGIISITILKMTKNIYKSLCLSSSLSPSSLINNHTHHTKIIEPLLSQLKTTHFNFFKNLI